MPVFSSSSMLRFSVCILPRYIAYFLCRIVYSQGWNKGSSYCNCRKHNRICNYNNDNILYRNLTLHITNNLIDLSISRILNNKKDQENSCFYMIWKDMNSPHSDHNQNRDNSFYYILKNYCSRNFHWRSLSRISAAHRGVKHQIAGKTVY